jgi:ATP adenylyltransferase
MEYIDSARDEEETGCLFCEKPKENDDEKAQILARQEKSFAMLNKYPYNSGHLMVAPYRHLGQLEDLEDEESLDTQKLLGRSIKALKEAMKPDGFNLGMNLGRVAGAGMPDHLHWHVVPRWSGDTNFMPTVSYVKVLPEGLSASYARIQERFAEDSI